ncbi:hypothetical protein EDB92DRAFT_1819507 [Lactarius akahatsu]|uniref:Uncharacterized protein n=1 Tax=Lactarius akahatsu TaxID=416441 RepID=A0AAD4L980_9AGAM|nr:hypothetical protein EDB92DRAFT_1819507 [Lactarius akahatsu]
MPVSQYTSIRTVLEVHALPTAGQLDGGSASINPRGWGRASTKTFVVATQYTESPRVAYPIQSLAIDSNSATNTRATTQAYSTDVHDISGTPSRRASRIKHRIYIKYRINNVPDVSKLVCKVDISVGRIPQTGQQAHACASSAAPWRDAGGSPCGVIVQMMGRLDSIVDEIIPAYHFEDHSSTSYDVTSGQFTFMDIMRIQWLLYLGYVRAAREKREKKQQLKITWITDLGPKADPMLREAPATDTNPSTESRGGRAAYAAFAMAMRGCTLASSIDFVIALSLDAEQSAWPQRPGHVSNATTTFGRGRGAVLVARSCGSKLLINNAHHVQVQAVADFDGLGIFFWYFFLGTHHLGWRLIATAGWFLGRRKTSESALQSPSAYGCEHRRILNGSVRSFSSNLKRVLKSQLKNAIHGMLPPKTDTIGVPPHDIPRSLTADCTRPESAKVNQIIAHTYSASVAEIATGSPPLWRKPRVWAHEDRQLLKESASDYKFKIAKVK